MPALLWPLPVTTTLEKMESTAFLTVVKPAKITLGSIMLPLIVKDNVDFAPFAMPLPKLLSPDAVTAKMESTPALTLATRERNIVGLVLRLVTYNL